MALSSHKVRAFPFRFIMNLPIVHVKDRPSHKRKSVFVPCSDPSYFTKRLLFLAALSVAPTTELRKRLFKSCDLYGMDF